MKITVEYWTQLLPAAGVREETVELPGSQCSLAALLQHLGTLHGQSLRKCLLDDNARPIRSNLILIGGARVVPDSDPAIADGAKVTLIAPMAGG